MARGKVGLYWHCSSAVTCNLPDSIRGSARWFQISPASVWVHDGVAHSRRIYLEESLRTNDGFTDQLEDDVADMRTIMGLGTREAADIRSEIVSKNYKCAPPPPEAPLHSHLGCQC